MNLKVLKLKIYYFIMDIIFLFPLKKFFFYRFTYMMTPAQYSFLISCINKTKDIPGGILEIGCANGMTTVYLNKHIEYEKIQKSYCCIDTFDGYMKEDILYEKNSRGLNIEYLKTAYFMRKKWVDYTLKLNNCSHVKSIQADINKYELSKANLGKLSFSLIDVNLYNPTISALKKVIPLMEKGSIILVDDCDVSYYNGALEAFQAFTSENKITSYISPEGFGVIEF